MLYPSREMGDLRLVHDSIKKFPECQTLFYSPDSSSSDSDDDDETLPTRHPKTGKRVPDAPQYGEKVTRPLLGIGKNQVQTLGPRL
jgi:hypothetical protein